MKESVCVIFCLHLPFSWGFVGACKECGIGSGNAYCRSGSSCRNHMPFFRTKITSIFGLFAICAGKSFGKRQIYSSRCEALKWLFVKIEKCLNPNLEFLVMSLDIWKICHFLCGKVSHAYALTKVLQGLPLLKGIPLQLLGRHEFPSITFSLWLIVCGQLGTRVSPRARSCPAR